VFVVSVCVPKGPECVNVVEFYTERGLPASATEVVDALVEAYQITAKEDRALCLSMESGRDTLIAYGRGDEPLGPMHPIEEGCVRHYFEVLDRLLLEV
jgi:hypothetical protein